MRAYAPEVSPDGRWLAFNATALSHDAHPDVFVQAFPGPGKRMQVSQWGTNPAWSPDGKTLYYLSGSGLSAVDVHRAGDTITASAPRLLFPGAASCRPVRCFDLSPDGSRFLIRPRGAATVPRSATRMDILINWTSTLPR